MGTKIPDDKFKGPGEINKLDCISASRHLEKVGESVKVIRCCQDSTNTSLVEVDFQLVGVFLFHPHLDILEVDGIPYKPSREAPIARGHFKNVDTPINTNCKTYNGTLVFDFSSAIPDFLSAREIKFQLRMIGKLDKKSLKLNFPEQTVTDKYVWNKGVLPRPINMRYENGKLQVQFEYGGDIDCSCNISCVTPTGLVGEVKFCPDQRQTVTVNAGPLTGNPSNLVLEFSDTLGNYSRMNIQSQINVIPQSPSVSEQKKPRRLEIGISRKALNNENLDEVEYQIWKYEGNLANASVWKDWSHRDWKYFVDPDVISERTYGYAVRYKGKFGDVTRLSQWTEVTLS